MDNFGGSFKPVLLISLFFILNYNWPISSSILACSVKAWCNREMCRVVFSSILSLRSFPPCTSEQFACADGTSCIPKSWLCTGYGGCNDLSGMNQTITSSWVCPIQTKINTIISTLEQMVSITVVTLGWENVRKVAATNVPVAKH